MPLRSDSESEWQDWLPDDTLDQETRMAETQEVDERKELLTVALGELPEREREIIIARRLQDDPATLEDLSHRLGISRERVRQIEVRAFDRLQKSMKNALRDKRAAMIENRVAD